MYWHKKIDIDLKISYTYVKPRKGANMNTQTIRKSGNASIISIPKKLLELLNLHVGDKVNIDVKDKKIVLTPDNNMTLEQMLDASPSESFKVIEDDGRIRNLWVVI